VNSANTFKTMLNQTAMPGTNIDNRI